MSDDYSDLFAPNKKSELQREREAEAMRRQEGWKRNIATAVVVGLVLAVIFMMKG